MRAPELSQVRLATARRCQSCNTVVASATHAVEGILVAFAKARQLSRAWIPVVTRLGILTLQQLLRQVAARACT